MEKMFNLFKANPTLRPFRVTIKEEPSDKSTIHFDCAAEDSCHAEEQALNAYPGCEIETVLSYDWSDLKYVVYSPNEAATQDGSGFWSNAFGWVDFDEASRFSEYEATKLNLPLSVGGDAQFLPVSNFTHDGLPVSCAPQVQPENAQMMVSLDGGVTYTPAPCGVRVIYTSVGVPGEDEDGELHVNLTHEGIIKDVYVSREEHLDYNIGKSQSLIEDMVSDMVSNMEEENA